MLAFEECQGPLTVLVLCLLLACSLDSNHLTDYGEDMSGIIQFADALKQNSSLTSLECASHSLNSSPKVSTPSNRVIGSLLRFTACDRITRTKWLRSSSKKPRALA